MLIVAVGAAFLRADFSVSAFYGVNDPARIYLETYHERWQEDDMLLVVADGGEAGGLLERSVLQDLDALMSELEEVEGVDDVISPTRIPRVRRGFAGQWIPVPLVGTVPPEDAAEERLTAWRTSVLEDPALVPTFLSEDGRYGSIMVGLNVDTGDLTQVKPVVEAVQAKLDAFEAGDVRFLVGGVPAIRADVLGVIVRDQVMLVPIAALLMGGLLALLFRSRHGVLIPGVAAGVPAAMLLGSMGWTAEPFGLLNQVFLALVPAIAVADAVHLVSRYHEEADALGGASKDMDVDIRNQAIVRAMSYMGLACFLTSFTTIIGFLSLLGTNLAVLRNFGLYAAIGVGLAYFTVLFIVPLALLSTRSGARHLEHDDEGNIGAMLKWSHRAATRTPGVVLAVALATVVGFGVLGYQVRADWKVTETFDEDHPVSVANALVDEHLGGVLALEMDLEGPEGTFSQASTLKAVFEAEESAVDAHDPIRTSASAASIVAATSRLVGGPLGVPEAGFQRIWSLAERAGQLQRFVSEDGTHARVLLRTRDMGTVSFLQLGRDVQASMQEALRPLDIEVHATGSSLVASRGVSSVTSDLRDSLIAAFGVIAIIIAGLFRKVRYGVLSILPNVLPLVVALGVMAVAGWTLEPGAAVVFTISVGISVDSAIHVFARFDEARSQGLSVDEALRDAIFHSGRAILITTMILIVGFAVNINSSAPANAAFGRIGTIIIGVALVSNLLVLPSLLKLAVKDEAPAA